MTRRPRHHRAKLTDHEVELMRALLADRRTLVTRLRYAGEGQGAIDRALRDRALSYRGIALKFEVSVRLVRLIATGARRP